MIVRQSNWNLLQYFRIEILVFKKSPSTTTRGVHMIFYIKRQYDDRSGKKTRQYEQPSRVLLLGPTLAVQSCLVNFHAGYMFNCSISKLTLWVLLGIFCFSLEFGGHLSTLRNSQRRRCIGVLFSVLVTCKHQGWKQNICLLVLKCLNEKGWRSNTEYLDYLLWLSNRLFFIVC